MTGAALRQLDPESSLAQDDHEALRLWLRLFTTTTMVERVVDSTLKREFGSSLPRFDLLSQLYRAPDGLRMGELSERILVTNGNVTWLVAALADSAEAAVSWVAPSRRSRFVARSSAAIMMSSPRATRRRTRSSLTTTPASWACAGRRSLMSVPNGMAVSLPRDRIPLHSADRVRV